MEKRSGWVLVVFLLSMTILSGCGGSASYQAAEPSAAPALAQTAPAEAEALARRAEAEEKAGRLSAAIPLWERIAQGFPRYAVAAKAFYRLGRIYLNQRQPDRALQYFEYGLYAYPNWDEANLIRLARLEALWATGKKKQVMKDAPPLWEASAGQPEVQLGLSQLMAEAYQSEGDRESAFEWLGAGFASAANDADRKQLTKATLDVLKDMNEATVKKILNKRPSDFMRVFLDYRMAQLNAQQPEVAREQLKTLLAKNPTHPLVPEIQAALRGGPAVAAAPVFTPAAEQLPLNPDRVGCLIPMNGSYGKYGRLVMRGLSCAAEEWNERHPDQRVSLVVKDSQPEPDPTIKSFEELTRQDGVLGIIGPLGAQPVKAVAPLADKWNVPLLALTQKEDDTPPSSFVLHVFLDNRELVKSLVRYCRERLGYTRFATLYPDDRYGQRLSKIFAEVVQEQGGQLLASIPYKEKSTDFKDPIGKLLTVAKQNIPPTGVDTTPFEALFIPDQVQTVSLIAPQLPYNNVVGATLLGTNLWGEAPLVEAGGAYVEQAIFATPFNPDSQAARVKAFREKYQEIYQATPSYLEAQAYDALMLFLEARSSLRSGGDERAALMQNLLQIHDYQGVAGDYSFSPDGQLSRSYQLLQVMNGQLVKVSP